MDERDHPTSNTELSSALSSVLSNPALLKSIGGLLGTSGGDDTPKAPTADGLSSVLSNPALMAKLPEVMAMLKPMLSATDSVKTDNAEPNAASPSDSSAENASIAVSAPKKRPPTDCRDDLLLALKPFLSPGRCEAVDTIIRLSRLGTVLKHL